MPNILLTQQCVRSCPYCFADKRMGLSAPGSYLGWGDLIYLADLHDRAGDNTFRLLGGEPTLHPEFVDMVLYLLRRGFNIQVFTSGVLGKRLLGQLQAATENVPAERVVFTCNINDPTETPASETCRIEAFLDAFGPRVTPGFNIYQDGFDLTFLFDLINRYGLQRRLRIGIAHPILGYDNKFIGPDMIKSVARRLAEMFPLFSRHRVSLGFDCGFLICAFTKEQLAELFTLSGGRMRFSCSPVCDIGPDGSVWGCFPLSEFRPRSIYEFNGFDEMARYFEKVFHMVRIEAAGVFEDCDECFARENGICKGGCLAHNLNALSQEPSFRKLEQNLESIC